MRRRFSWLTTVVELVVLITIFYAGISVWLSYWLSLRAHEIAGRTITVGRIRVFPPLTVVLDDVQFMQREPMAAIAIPKVVVVPQGVSWADKRVWLKSVELHAPWLRVKRTPEGIVVWRGLGLLQAPISKGVAEAAPPPAGEDRWGLAVRSVTVLNGTVQFEDETLAQPFWGSLTDLLLVTGPVLLPPELRRMSVAVQGRLIGHKQLGAPVFCSGWMNLDAKALDVSCELKPLKLGAFQPYYEEEKIQPGVFNATLGATGHLSAKDNALEGAVQLTIEELSETDIRFLNRAIQAAQNQEGHAEVEPRLAGQLQITGLLDAPNQWTYQLAPGNAIVQHLVDPLLHRGVAKIPIKVGEQVINVGLTSATKEDMSNIEEAGKTVQENLKMVAPAPGEMIPVSASAPAEPLPAPVPDAGPQPTAQ